MGVWRVEMSSGSVFTISAHTRAEAEDKAKKMPGQEGAYVFSCHLVERTNG